MSRLLSRAKRIYRERGTRYLIQRGVEFVFSSVLWTILPKGKTLRTISKSRILTGLYFLVQGTFYQEQRAVLCGIAQHHSDEYDEHVLRSRIIRSTHRIEKGLSMKERRDIFAESYIQDLVSDIGKAWTSSEDDQLKWTVDVLSKYFDIVADTETISQAEDDFQSFLSEVDYSPHDNSPMPRSQIGDPPISPDELKQLATQRTSTRWFEQRPVPHEAIDEAIEVALESPSACNRQSYEFRVYDDPELINEISSLAVGAGGYSDNIPCLVVIVGKQRAYFNDRDKHVIYIDASLASMAFQFSLETQDLASCCINWPAIPEREREMEELLGLDSDEQVVMLMAVGYPDEEELVPFSAKKRLDEVRFYNEIPE